jgi:hypothetical protein
VNLASDIALFLHVEPFVDLRKAAFAQQHEEQVALVKDRMVVVSTLVLVVYSFQLPEDKVLSLNQ